MREIMFLERKARGAPGPIDLGSHMYVMDGDRFVVVLAASYSEEDLTADGGKASPEEAVAAALDLTRDLGSWDTCWRVLDREIGRWYVVEQGDAERKGTRHGH